MKNLKDNIINQQFRKIRKTHPVLRIFYQGLGQGLTLVDIDKRLNDFYNNGHKLKEDNNESHSNNAECN